MSSLSRTPGDLKDYLEDLTPFLKDGSNVVRQSVVICLGRTGEKGVKLLLPMLGDADAIVRSAVAGALGAAGEAGAFIAVRVGSTRLIDNLIFGQDADPLEAAASPTQGAPG